MPIEIEASQRLEAKYEVVENLLRDLLKEERERSEQRGEDRQRIAHLEEKVVILTTTVDSLKRTIWMAAGGVAVLIGLFEFLASK